MLFPIAGKVVKQRDSQRRNRDRATAAHERVRPNQEGLTQTRAEHGCDGDLNF